MVEYQRGSHTLHDIKYHLVWITCGLHLESDDLGVKPLLRFHRWSGKALEPANETVVLGQIFEATEAGKQRIALK